MNLGHKFQVIYVWAIFDTIYRHLYFETLFLDSNMWDNKDPSFLFCLENSQESLFLSF